MNQTVYILILISLVVLAFNKYEMRNWLGSDNSYLKDQAFTEDIKENPSETDNINAMSSMPSPKTIDWDSYLL